MAITKIAQVDVGLSGASTMSFTSIPATYTDLMVVVSGKIDNYTQGDIQLTVNGSTSGYYSGLYLQGSGSAVTSVNGGSGNAYANIRNVVPGYFATANTFSNIAIYIPNYAGATNKRISFDGVGENNAAAAYQAIVAAMWANTSAITSITIGSNAANFIQYSSATLYGISKSGATGASVS